MLRPLAGLAIIAATADAAFQDVFIQKTDGVGNDDTHLAAFTLYSLP